MPSFVNWTLQESVRSRVNSVGGPLQSQELLPGTSNPGVCSAEFNKCGGPAGHQVRILWGPAEIYTLPVQMSDTIFLQYLVNISCFQVKHV